MLVYLVAVLVSSASAAISHTSYCSLNTLDSNASWPQFTKEPVPYEYGFEDMFKSIHCCAGGYRNIDWFKNDVPHPWSAGVSNFIEHPESANQTLYTRRLRRSDAGNYTCRISNETHSEQHTIVLDVLEKPPDEPKTMYLSKDQWVSEGARVRLYCEALVGRSYLADTHSDLSWRKSYPNGTEGVLLPSQTEIKTKREDVEEIIGAYLSFGAVTAADYGTYVCAVRSNGALYRNTVTLHYKSAVAAAAAAAAERARLGAVPWRALCAMAAGALLLAAALLALHRRCTPRLLLAARIAHARATAAAAPAEPEKEFDVVVCWCGEDEALARGALLPTLALKYRYRVCALPLPADPAAWYGHAHAAAGRARALAALVSPRGLGAPQLREALRQLHALPLPPVVILLQDLPRLKYESKDSNGESLGSLLRRTRLVAWRHVHDRAFWTALRLALPLPPVAAATNTTTPTALHENSNNQTEEGKDSRSGSLTALV